MAEGVAGRGSFLDLLDAGGVDRSRAFVRRAVIEKGSGPLHAIVRIEGEYLYSRPDNRPAPFVTRIHAYAGRSYVRVQHTFVYTGVPDRHRPQGGDQPHVATQDERLITVDPTDTGWTEPEDRVAAAGLSVGLLQSGDRRLTTRWREGAWWDDGVTRTEVHDVGGTGEVSLFQTGPEPSRMPPLRSSSSATRMDGFSTHLVAGGRTLAEAERAEGWAALSGDRYGVAIGIRHFLEEYPKEIRFGASSGPGDAATAYLWSPRAEPMSFARFSNELGPENAVENWATGLAKTSEVVFDFQPAGMTDADLVRTMSAVVAPPVAHADPDWYGRSGVYGRFAPSTGRFPDFERALDYKFDWVLFNQQWEPWFGMFDHGDLQNSFDGVEWSRWGHGEPAQDYMLWLQFHADGQARAVRRRAGRESPPDGCRQHALAARAGLLRRYEPPARLLALPRGTARLEVPGHRPPARGAALVARAERARLGPGMACRLLSRRGPSGTRRRHPDGGAAPAPHLG